MADIEIEEERARTKVAVLGLLQLSLAILNSVSTIAQTVLIMVYMTTCSTCHSNDYFPAFIPLNILSMLAIAHVLSSCVTCLQWTGLKWLQGLSCIIFAYLWHFYWVSTELPGWLRLTILILAWVSFMTQFGGFGLAFYSDRERIKHQILKSARAASTTNY